VTSAIANYGDVVELLKAGKLRALAATSKIEPLPDLPTVAAFGLKDFESDTWFGLVAPAKTPKEAVAQLAGWFTQALQSPELKQSLAIHEVYPVAICGADYGAYIREQYAELGRAIHESDIKPE
jgi:tripartite-type tricarboxylate transporter receptor subunit TctC